MHKEIITRKDNLRGQTRNQRNLYEKVQRINFGKGDHVLVSKAILKVKLSPTWTGPYEVVVSVNDQEFIVRNSLDNSTAEVHSFGTANGEDYTRMLVGDFTSIKRIEFKIWQWLDWSVIMQALGLLATPLSLEPLGKKSMIKIRKTERPGRKKELMRFLGVCGYYRGMIFEYASLIQPPEDLLRKGVSWIWGTYQKIALYNLKELLARNDHILGISKLGIPV